MKCLEDLNSSYYRDEETGTHLVPWELRVLAVRLQGMGYADARRGVMGFYELAREARLILTSLKKSLSISSIENEKESLEEEIRIWEFRLQELGIRVASALVEMEDLEGAARFLTTLDPSSPGLESQKALLWLCLGDVEAARACAQEDRVVGALASMADGEYGVAAGSWEELVSSAEGGDRQEKAMCRQNLAVCYLYLGRMDSVCSPLSSPTFSGLVEKMLME